MNVIRGSNQRPTWGIDSIADTFNALAVINCPSVLKTALLIFLALCLVLTDGAAAATDEIKSTGAMVPLKSVAQIKIDDDNHPLNFPVEVFFDPVEEEIYLINGGINRVVVYGPDFFPRVSIGIGRGVLSPTGVLVMRSGEVYITQVQTSRNPSSRITILNGAFFVDREIFLDQIPEAADFRPKQLIVSRDGIIYLAGDNMRGVLVLDNEGNFLRRLQPKDQIVIRGAEEAAMQAAEEEEQQAEQGQQFSVEIEETAPEEEVYADIPEEFRPKTREERMSESQEVFGPVKINHVNIDSVGNLYLTSAETGKIYVYGPDEGFRYSFGTKGGSPGQMSMPKSLAIDEENELIYVVDYMRHSILAYEMKTGEYLFEFGGRGIGPGFFNFPTSITINNYNQVIIADLYNKRVQVLEIGFEAISYYRDALTAELLPESTDSVESAEQDEFVAGQPGEVSDQENEPEAVLEQPEEVFEEEIVEELVAGQPDDVRDQENEPQASLEQPEEVFEEEIVEELVAGQPDPPGQAGPVPAQKPEVPAAQTEVLQESSKPDDEISPAPPSPLDQPAPAAQAEAPKTPAVEASEKPSEPGMPAVQPPDFGAVEPFVKSWAAAWEQQDIELYLSHYSRDFSTPGGISITAWEKDRHKRLGRPKFIRIGILDMQKQKLNDSRAQVTFIQEFQTDTYSDQGLKTLELIWENGGWLIINEIWKVL